jgi:hypothetical protein
MAGHRIPPHGGFSSMNNFIVFIAVWQMIYAFLYLSLMLKWGQSPFYQNLPSPASFRRNDATMYNDNNKEGGLMAATFFARKM